MPTRSNACSELTRLWLEARLGYYFVTEAVAVPVPYALSDIDFVALHPRADTIHLSIGETLGPRIIVETKDEHDWEPTGWEFGVLLQADMQKMGDGHFIPRKTAGVKFTMLRAEHYEKACEIFGSEDFDRLFVVHALDQQVRAALAPSLAERRIHWITIRDTHEPTAHQHR